MPDATHGPTGDGPTGEGPTRGGGIDGVGLGRIAGAAALITVLTLVARVAGFGRTFVFLRTVGKHDLADVYNAANTIPNIVFELVAGGALASLVVPLLAGAVAAGDRRRVAAVTSALLTWVLTLLVPAAVLLAVLAGPVTALLVDAPVAEQQVAARMLRVFAPQLPLYGLGIVLVGVLQAHHRFAWPVIAPLLSSVTVMGAYLTYALIDGPESGFGGLSRAGELTLSLGTTAGVVVLATCLLVPLRRLRLPLRPGYRFPGDEGRQAVRLGWAGAVTVGAQQVMIIVVLVLTSDGGLTRFVAAQTVFLLPWAVLAVPLATAAYPGLAAAATRGDETAYSTALAGAARSVALLTCLGAAALGGLAVPAARILGLGADADGIVGLAPGLLGYGLFALLSRALYARGATVAAAVAVAAGWGLGAVVAPLLSAVLGAGRQIFALGLAHTVGTSTIGVLLVLAVRRHAGAAALAGLGRAAGTGIVAGTLAGLAGWAVVRASAGTPAGGSAVVGGMLGGIVVAAVFLAVAYGLDSHDVRPLVRRLTRRRGTRPAGAAPAAADRLDTAPAPDGRTRDRSTGDRSTGDRVTPGRGPSDGRPADDDAADGEEQT